MADQEELISKEATLVVSKTAFGEEKETIEKIRVTPFHTDTATVSVKGGATINLGNYESARIDVMLVVPCYVEEIDTVFPKVKEWVDAKLAKEYKELKQVSGK